MLNNIHSRPRKTRDGRHSTDCSLLGLVGRLVERLMTFTSPTKGSNIPHSHPCLFDRHVVEFPALPTEVLVRNVIDGYRSIPKRGVKLPLCILITDQLRNGGDAIAYHIRQ